MSTTTTNYGLIKPGTDDPILVGQLNDNMDTIDTVLKDHSDKIDAAALGIKYKGEVNYYADLPNSAEIGDAYTVKYSGTSGTTPDGTEYVWGTASGTNQWINFSKDSYTKSEVDALLALKQNALTTAQLAAVNSGIDSTKVAQIEMNKNNILSTYTSTTYACTASNTYEYTGISITCNANQLLEVWIVDEKGGSTALGIIVSDSNTSITTDGSIIAENNTTYTSNVAALWSRELHCVLPPKKRSSSKTFYVWVKRAGTASNNIQVITRPIVINQ